MKSCRLVAEKDKVTKTLESEDVTKRFKEAEKVNTAILI